MDRKRPKNSRLRGSHTHGWGAKKKHRGAGNRGGHGAAGSGKRGDAKKPTYWKDRSYYKSKGFTSLKTPKTALNLSDLGKFKNTKIDLIKEGYDKLLGMGNVTQKLEVTVRYASKSAIKKIEDAGGKVLGLQEVKKPKKKTTAENKKKPSKEETDVE